MFKPIDNLHIYNCMLKMCLSKPVNYFFNCRGSRRENKETFEGDKDQYAREGQCYRSQDKQV